MFSSQKFFFLSFLPLCEMTDVNYGGNHFTIYVNQIMTLYALNLYSNVCQFFSTKLEKKKGFNKRVIALQHTECCPHRQRRSNLLCHVLGMNCWSKQFSAFSELLTSIRINKLVTIKSQNEFCAIKGLQWKLLPDL